MEGMYKCCGVTRMGTLILPKTDFPMKAGLPRNEPKQLEAWQGGNIYERILDTRKGKPLFVLHDGRLSHGEIHLGTGLNKYPQDLVVKSKSIGGALRALRAGVGLPWVPIETQVEKELGGKVKSAASGVSKAVPAIRAALRRAAQERFQRLGHFRDVGTIPIDDEP